MTGILAAGNPVARSRTWQVIGSRSEGFGGDDALSVVS